MIMQKMFNILNREIGRIIFNINFEQQYQTNESHCIIIPPRRNVGGILDSLCPVGRSAVRPSPIRVRSITPLLMEGLSSNLNDTFTLTRGYAEPMLSMCKLKVKVTVKCQILNKQILDIMSCPFYKPYANGFL